MSVNMYPSVLQDGKAIHVNKWSEDMTLNFANGNFYSLMNLFGIGLEETQCISLPYVEQALVRHSMSMNRTTNGFEPEYITQKKIQIMNMCAKGKDLGATHIAAA